MDVSFAPQVNAVQTPGQAQNTVGATAEAGATATVQRVPDNVVTAATESAETNEREDDASKRESRPDTPPTLDTFQNLKFDGLDTRLGFDNESEVFFLEILQPNTDDVIQRIPSESLIEYLDEKFDELVAAAATPSSQKNLDRSI